MGRILTQKKNGKEIADFLRDEHADHGDYFHAGLAQLLKVAFEQEVLTNHQLAVMLYSLFISIWENNELQGEETFDEDIGRDVDKTLERKVHEIRSELAAFLVYQEKALGKSFKVIEGIISPGGARNEFEERGWEDMGQDIDDARAKAEPPKTDDEIIEEFRKIRRKENPDQEFGKASSAALEEPWQTQERWNQLDEIMDIFAKMIKHLKTMMKAQKAREPKKFNRNLVDVNALGMTLDPLLKKTGLLNEDDAFWDDSVELNTEEKIKMKLKELNHVVGIVNYDLLVRDYEALFGLISDYRESLLHASDEGGDDDQIESDEDEETAEDDNGEEDEL